MKWEEIYEKTKFRKRQKVKEIASDFLLRTNIRNIESKNKKIVAIIILCIIVLLILTFYSSPKALLLSILFVLMLSVMFSFFHQYSLKGQNGKMEIKANGQTIVLLYDKIKNIYIEETTSKICFRKVKQYFLVILYETSKKNICDITLPITLLKKKEVVNWFQMIEVEPTKINYQTKCQQYKRKRFWRKMLFYFLCITLVVLISLCF